MSPEVFWGMSFFEINCIIDGHFNKEKSLWQKTCFSAAIVINNNPNRKKGAKIVQVDDLLPDAFRKGSRLDKVVPAPTKSDVSFFKKKFGKKIK